MTNAAKVQQSSTTSGYKNIIAALSILGIGCYLVLKYALDCGNEVYTLTFNTELASVFTSVYQGHTSFSIAMVQLPLIAVLALGGIPLLYQLVVKLFRGNFGADLLACISIITAVMLD